MGTDVAMPFSDDSKEIVPAGKGAPLKLTAPATVVRFGLTVSLLQPSSPKRRMTNASPELSAKKREASICAWKHAFRIVDETLNSNSAVNSAYLSRDAEKL
jgi:hypothetical protein